MIMQLYCVYDAKLGEYLPPFISQNDQVAKRQFESAVAEEGHAFRKHAEDYSLWGIANFDSEKAFITTYELQPIAQAHELLANIRRMEAIRDQQLYNEQQKEIS